MNRNLTAVLILAAIPCLAATRATADDKPPQVVQPSPDDLQGDFGHPAPARTHGWSWKLPPDLVTPTSAKRNNVFFVGEPVSFSLGGAASTYEVRNYYGNLVDKGPASATTPIHVTQPGWYKLYVFGKQVRPEWGDVVGGATFVIFRNDPHFPPLPAKDAPEPSNGVDDEVMRGVTGMGPQRHAADASKPDESIKNLEGEIALDRQLYLPFDSVRKRVLMIAFPNGTKDLDGVRKIVEHFKNDVQYWEPRNEPNFGSSGADFALKEMKPFYDTVKAVDPNLKVLGPGTVTIGPSLLGWIEDFLKAGGAKYIDAFSFHAYNNVNGDVWLARTALNGLEDLLKKYDADNLEKWQTEQGYFAAVYGSYQPRLEGRWTMVQMMVYEQYGIPKEHNHLWYDRSHGFWDVPTWWENDDGGLNPAASLMRTWSEELYGTQFSRAFDFGNPGNQIYLGSLFTGPEKRVAAFMSAGSTDGKVNLAVTGGRNLRVISAFGVESTIPVRGGKAVLPVPELPVYVELERGQNIQVIPTDWGPDLALAPGVTAAASIKPDTDDGKTAAAEYDKLHNGELENWYYAQKKDSGPWRMGNGDFPGWVEIDLPAAQRIDRVVVYAAPPWQSQSTLLDYDLQADQDGKWVTLDHVQEPTKTWGVFSPATRTTVDSFFSDRWIFQHQFKPVTTRKIRLRINATTYGGGATKIVQEAGGQTWGEEVVLREIAVYSR